jgi:hypothetical protein
MLNSGPHESFDAAQMSAADHAALRARLLALFPVPSASIVRLRSAVVAF